MTLKVFPRPTDRWLQAYAVPDMRTGLEVIRHVLREGWRPAVVRLHDEIEAERSYDGAVNRGESILLLLSEGPDGYAQAEGKALDRASLAAGLRPLGPGPVEAWLAHRNDVQLFEQLIRAGILVDTIAFLRPELSKAGSAPSGRTPRFALARRPSEAAWNLRAHLRGRYRAPARFPRALPSRHGRRYGCRRTATRGCLPRRQ